MITVFCCILLVIIIGIDFIFLQIKIIQRFLKTSKNENLASQNNKKLNQENQLFNSNNFGGAFLRCCLQLLGKAKQTKDSGARINWGRVCKGKLGSVDGGETVDH